jgi:hypothetical protein
VTTSCSMTVHRHGNTADLCRRLHVMRDSRVAAA